MTNTLRQLLAPAVLAAALLASATGCTALVEETGLALLDTASASLRKHDHEDAAGFTDELSRRYGDEVETRRKLEAMRELQAAGDAAAYAKVEPYLRDPQSRLRLAAVQALRMDLSAEAVAALAERLAEDAAADVRVAAAALLAERPDDAAWEAVRAAATGDRSAAVRRAIVERLAGSQDASDDALELLRQVQENDADPAIRGIAGSRGVGSSP